LNHLGALQLERKSPTTLIIKHLFAFDVALCVVLVQFELHIQVKYDFFGFFQSVTFLSKYILIFQVFKIAKTNRRKMGKGKQLLLHKNLPGIK